MYYKKTNDQIKTPIFIKLPILFVAIIIGFFILRIFIAPYTIYDNSMNPNLKKSDTVFAFKLTTPQKGDIVLFNSPLQPDKLFVKRIIAVSGDKIEIINKRIKVNNKLVNFKWPINLKDKRILSNKFSNQDNMKAITIKQDHYFVIGDNLDQSFDSKEIGLINKEQVIGKIFLKF
jgi:signal peptidase I